MIKNVKIKNIIFLASFAYLYLLKLESFTNLCCLGLFDTGNKTISFCKVVFKIVLRVVNKNVVNVDLPSNLKLFFFKYEISCFFLTF